MTDQGAARQANAMLVWGKGIVPQLSTESLSLLHEALVAEDPQLIQGCTIRTSHDVDGQTEISGCCAITYGPWKSAECVEPDELKGRFRTISDKCDKLLTMDLLSLTDFIYWFDRNRRQDVFAILAAEVQSELGRRTAQWKS